MEARFIVCLFVADQYTVLASFLHVSLIFVFYESDPALVDLEQMDLQMLCDGLRRYLQDLPQPVIPSMIYTEMMRIAQGEFPQDYCPSALGQQQP